MQNPVSKNTKIVATVGPASNNYDTLLALVRAGVNVFRLNFSHGTHEQHKEVINHITYINEKYGLHIGILADLQGPKLRVGEIENNGIQLDPGDIVTFVNEPCVGNKERIYMSYRGLAKDVEAGERILLDDGKLVFEVIETNGEDTVKLKVIYGGILKSKKGVNLPDTNVSLPALTEKDLIDLDFLLTQPVNWIALSFVRSADDVIDLKQRLEAAKHPAKVISKIEKPEAVKNIKSIIKASNAIMIARGDLAVELPYEQLPSIQKDIIRRCIQRARPVIVATQMLESMIEAPSPTRAEITDVANAVMDGADALMLSAETAAGKYPVQVIDTMVKIIKNVEKEWQIKVPHPEPSSKASTFLSDVICIAAARAADDIGAKAIVGMTGTGYTAFKISSYRPHCMICTFSDRPHMLSTLNLVWGVRCFYYDKFVSTDDTIHDVAEILRSEGYVESGDFIINTASMPLARRQRTNMMKITKVD